MEQNLETIWWVLQLRVLVGADIDGSCLVVEDKAMEKNMETIMLLEIVKSTRALYTASLSDRCP